MNGPEHYREAETLARAARARHDGEPLSHPNGEPILTSEAAEYAELAQVHATLALAAATALPHAGEMPVADHDAWFAAAGSRAAAALSAGKPPAAQPLAAVVDVAGLAVEEAAALGLQLINLNLDVHLPSLTVQPHPMATQEQGTALLDALSATCEPDVSRADGLTWYYLSALVPNDVLVRVVCRDEPAPAGGVEDLGSAGSPVATSRAKDGHDSAAVDSVGASADEPHLPAEPNPLVCGGGRAPADPADTCVVGDPDPTDAPRSKWCGVLSDGSRDPYECTRTLGHHGQHVAGDGRDVLAVWPQDTVLAGRLGEGAS